MVGFIISAVCTGGFANRELVHSTKSSVIYFALIRCELWCSLYRVIQSCSVILNEIVGGDHLEQKV
jgi:hypothetical protein